MSRRKSNLESKLAKEVFGSPAPPDRGFLSGKDVSQDVTSKYDLLRASLYGGGKAAGFLYPNPGATGGRNQVQAKRRKPPTRGGERTEGGLGGTQAPRRTTVIVPVDWFPAPLTIVRRRFDGWGLVLIHVPILTSWTLDTNLESKVIEELWRSPSGAPPPQIAHSPRIQEQVAHFHPLALPCYGGG